MKNKLKVVITIGVVIIIIGVIVLLFSKNLNKDNINVNVSDGKSEVTLGKEEWVNQLTDIKINGTNDTIKITKFVKWKVPDVPEGTTVSFAIHVPYTFTVDGKEYSGIYELNDAESSTKDSNPKYTFSVRDLTKDGKIKILVNKK